MMRHRFLLAVVLMSAGWPGMTSLSAQSITAVRQQRISGLLLDSMTSADSGEWKLRDARCAEVSVKELQEILDSPREMLQADSGDSVMFRAEKYLSLVPVQSCGVLRLNKRLSVYTGDQGAVKTISFWLKLTGPVEAGYVCVEDYFGIPYKLMFMGKGGWFGWKQITIAVPAALRQSHFYHRGNPALTITGLELVCARQKQEEIGFTALTAVADMGYDSRERDEGVMHDW